MGGRNPVSLIKIGGQQQIPWVGGSNPVSLIKHRRIAAKPKKGGGGSNPLSLIKIPIGGWE